MIALHVYSDWAVRPGVTMARFADGSRAYLFDSFKPGAGYSQYWFAIKPSIDCAIWWHVDARDVLPSGTVRFHAEPRVKVEVLRDLLQAAYPTAAALLAAAKPHALVADQDNNELRRHAP